MTNPLAKYYRIPGISVNIPSRGKYQPEGNVEFTISGEVEVSPMKASDELLLKSPDALISGKALESMLISCVPGVKDVRALPYNDVDALLVAIRAATYGNMLEISDTCPECEEDQTFDIDISNMIGRMAFLNESYTIEVMEGVVVHMRPLTFAENSVIGKRLFEETKRVQFETKAEGLTDDDRNDIASRAYNRMHELNLHIISQSIEKVVTPDDEVTDFDDIYDFVTNSPIKWFKELENLVKEITAVGVHKSAVVQCGNCQHDWETDIVFDPASFFKIGS